MASFMAFTEISLVIPADALLGLYAAETCATTEAKAVSNDRDAFAAISFSIKALKAKSHAAVDAKPTESEATS